MLKECATCDVIPLCSKHKGTLGYEYEYPNGPYIFGRNGFPLKLHTFSLGTEDHAWNVECGMSYIHTRYLYVYRVVNWMPKGRQSPVRYC